MKVMNWKALNKKDLFLCYSRPFCKFLEDNSILYIDNDIDKKTNKQFFVFLKTQRLEECREQWRKNKIDGKLAFPVKEVPCEKIELCD